MRRHVILLPIALLLFPSNPANAQSDTKAVPTFEKHIRPILKAHCFECHGEGKRLRGSLDLRLARLAREGGDTGPAVVPGRTAKSLLMKRIRKKEMPPGKVKLAPEQMALIERWIAGGAKTLRPEPKTIAKGVVFTHEERSFWAFQPIRRSAVPNVTQNHRVRTPIDAFLLGKLEAKGLAFSADAQRLTLMRRAYFDLIGLPPSPGDVRMYLADTSDKAYEKLLDRLLASSHYGERWGRHWLDVAGYADSEGYSNDDAVRPYAWKYRDYVIRAFNADKPLDEFIREQLAGDEMLRPPYRNLKAAELDKLIATGFLRMAPDGTGSSGVEKAVARNQVVADTVEIVSSSLLGLTVQCARCHNHKYDPITQEDYYRLRSIFEPALDWKNWRAPQARRVTIFSTKDRQRAAAIEQQAARIDKARLKRQAELVQQVFQRELAKVPEKFKEAVRTAKETPVAKRTKAQKDLLRRFPRADIRVSQLRLYDRKAAAELQTFVTKANKIRATKPSPDYVRALTEVPGKVPMTYLFHRGEHELARQPLTPAHLTILQPLKIGELPINDKARPTTGRRLAFAQQLTSGKHPSLPRVLVNRVWQHHFGRGLVGTSGDFGYLGDRPSHPELLDWLADDFVKHGWNLKRLHKLIMKSTAYRQSSRSGTAKRPQTIDPDNQLLWRMPLRRLEAEIMRDSILSVSGKLNKKAFGRPVPVTVTPSGEFVIGVDTRDGAGRFTKKIGALGGEEFRRSVYVQVRRSQRLSVLDTFDAPTLNPNCRVRNVSTVTPQALLMMNSKFMMKYAKHFADRVRQEAGKETRQQVTHAWQLAFAATPSDRDIKEATAFLQDQVRNFRSGTKVTVAVAQQHALTNFCQALLSSNRFLYVD